MNGRMNLRQLLKIPYDRLDDINAVLLDPDMQVINDFLAVVEKYGTPEEINRKAEQAAPAAQPAREGQSRHTRNICRIWNG